MESLSFAGAARECPRRIAWIAGEKRVTYAAANSLIASAANQLKMEGVRPGNRIAFVAEPSVGTLVTFFSIAAAGAIAVPLHPRLTSTEQAAQIKIAAARLLASETAVAELSSAKPLAEEPITRSPESPFAILFTSGSSGTPKGVVLSSRAFIASAAGLAEIIPFVPRERWLLCMPLAHVGGLSIVTRCLLARSTVVVESRFDPDRVLALITRDRITRLSVVPTMLDALLQKDVRGVLRRLRLLLIGGAACPTALLDECARRRLHARTTWGLTEACSMVTLQHRDFVENFEPGSGQALRGMEVAVACDENLLIRGNSMMTGYLGEPSLRPGEWFDTGDVGHLDGDRLIVEARRTDLIVTGGENVLPTEVERVLQSIAGVQRAIVFGIPDPHWGQIVAAALVSEPARTISDDAIRAGLAADLAAFKWPRRLCVVDELPQLPSGKLDRAGAAALLAGTLRIFRPQP